MIAGGIVYWFLFLGGRSQLDSLLGGVFNGGTNIQTRTNTGSNVSGGGNAQGIINDVFSKVGLNNGQSGQNIYRHRQVNYQNTANQNNVNVQRSNVI